MGDVVCKGDVSSKDLGLQQEHYRGIYGQRVIRGDDLQLARTDCLIRGNELQFERTDCLIRGNELQSERTSCATQENEILIHENGFPIRGNGLFNSI